MARLAAGTMATGKTNIADFADGGTMGFGKSFLKSLLMNLILNGWWLTLPLKSIRTGQEQKAATRIWGAQKRTQLKDISAVDAHMVCRSEWSPWSRCGLYAGLQTHGGIRCRYILADRGYDGNSFIEHIEEYGMKAVIPPRKNRKNQKGYGHYLYRYRHLVENAFAELKKWCGTVKRYAKYNIFFEGSSLRNCSKNTLSPNMSFLLFLWPRKFWISISPCMFIKAIFTEVFCKMLYLFS